MLSYRTYAPLDSFDDLDAYVSSLDPVQNRMAHVPLDSAPVSSC